MLVAVCKLFTVLNRKYADVILGMLYVDALILVDKSFDAPYGTLLADMSLFFMF